MIDRRKIKINFYLRICLSVLTMLVAGASIIFPNIYLAITSKEIATEYFSFDIVSFVSALILFILTLTIESHNPKISLISFGIIGYLFYVYGMYVLGNTYTVLYVVYTVILNISIFSLILGLTNMNLETARDIDTPPIVGNIVAVLLFMLAIIFASTWISRIFKTIVTQTKPLYEYPFYILDLSIVLPVFVLTSVLLIRRHWFGNILAAIVIVYCFILSTPTVIAEIVKYLTNQHLDFTVLTFFSILVIVGFFTNFFYYRYLRIKKEK